MLFKQFSKPARQFYRDFLTFLLVLSLTACATSGGSVSSTDKLSIASLTVDGPYNVTAYSAFPDVDEYADATIYYPVGVDSPIGGVAVSPGYTESQRHISWWGPRLASHGYAVLVFDTNAPGDSPAMRGEALIAAVRVLKGENSRANSPLNGQIDVNKMAIMGHSMGGGGTLFAADKYSNEIQAAIPFTPWLPEGDFSNISVPTLVIAGSADRIAAVNDHAWPHYQTIPLATTRVYLEVDGGNHFLANSGGPDLGTIGKYGIAWLKMYLDGDQRYADFIYGDAQKIDAGKFSRYIANP